MNHAIFANSNDTRRMSCVNNAKLTFQLFDLMLFSCEQPGKFWRKSSWKKFHQSKTSERPLSPLKYDGQRMSVSGNGRCTGFGESVVDYDYPHLELLHSVDILKWDSMLSKTGIQLPVEETKRRFVLAWRTIDRRWRRPYIMRKVTKRTGVEWEGKKHWKLRIPINSRCDRTFCWI